MVLLMRLAGPMQSWGTQSRFTHRDTGREPSKSGVIGLLCAACGIHRNETSRIRELAALPMGVRVDREGTLEKDYQTAGGGKWPNRQEYGVYAAAGGSAGTVPSPRYYLAGADFLVGLEAPEGLARLLQKALRDPVWPLYLGRRAFVPSVPVWVPDGLRPGAIRTVLREYPWRPPANGVTVPARLWLVLECAPEEGEPRLDVPVSFETDNRQFALRYVRNEWLETDGIPVARRGEPDVPLQVDTQP